MARRRTRDLSGGIRTYRLAEGLHRSRRTGTLTLENGQIVLFQVQMLIWHDDDYPARLKEIYDYPPVLYVRGAILPAIVDGAKPHRDARRAIGPRQGAQAKLAARDRPDDGVGREVENSHADAPAARQAAISATS